VDVEELGASDCRIGIGNRCRNPGAATISRQNRPEGECPGPRQSSIVVNAVGQTPVSIPGSRLAVLRLILPAGPDLLDIHRIFISY
jgi:hypothetical protein